MTIAAFDLDGTITKRDTFIEFIRFTKGYLGLINGFLLYSPLLFLALIRFYPLWKVKEKLFSYHFKGLPLSVFDKYCEDFIRAIDTFVFEDAVQEIKQHIQNGNEVVIVSASIENWIKPYAKTLGIKKVIGTKIVISDDEVSGRFMSANCKGMEKVNRLLAEFPQRVNYRLIAYGDSRGDKELLQFADKAYYKRFNR